MPIAVEPIQMSRLDVRAAWEIGENDPDMMARGPDDDPYIPEGVKDAPVLRTLARMTPDSADREGPQTTP